MAFIHYIVTRRQVADPSLQQHSCLCGWRSRWFHTRGPAPADLEAHP